MAGDFQPRELSGSVFPNDRKTQPNHPDYKGSCLIAGVEYWVSGWLKVTARGKFLSMAYQPKDTAARPTHSTVPGGGLDYVPIAQTQGKPKPKFDDMDEDDIPF